MLALEAQEAQGRELEERTEMEGGKGGRARGERRFWGSPPGFLASCAGSTCGLPERGSEGEVGNLQDPLTGFCSGKTESLPREGCAEPGGGAGRELGGQRGRGFFFMGYLSRALRRAAHLEDNDLDGVWG